MEIEIAEGLCKQIIRAAPLEKSPQPGDRVLVHYTGSLLADGSTFDSSRTRGEPFSFILGKGEVIKGWDLGVATMHRTERSNLICAPEMAYGATGSPPAIPANSTLIFDVELLDFYAEPTTVEEAVNVSESIKLQANELYGGGSFAEAARLYSRAHGYLKKFHVTSQLYTSILLNLLLVNNKLGAYGDNIRLANENKNLISSSVKGLLRLSIALDGMHEYSAALLEAEKAKKLNSQVDPAIDAHIAVIKTHIAEQERKERAAYSRLF